MDIRTKGSRKLTSRILSKNNLTLYKYPRTQGTQTALHREAERKPGVCDLPKVTKASVTEMGTGQGLSLPTNMHLF